MRRRTSRGDVMLGIDWPVDATLTFLVGPSALYAYAGIRNFLQRWKAAGRDFWHMSTCWVFEVKTAKCRSARRAYGDTCVRIEVAIF
jgi:hypothetical protein